jgi:hypothetical protein
MPAASWQPAHSAAPFAFTPNGLPDAGTAWHVSHWAAATGAWTLVFSSPGCAEL